MKNNVIFLVLISCFNLVFLSNLPSDYVDDVQISTRLGTVNGFQAELSPDFNADIFLGIPFAKQPIDDLRFEKTESVEAWSKPLEAKEFSKGCWPHDLSGMSTDYFSDDCLYLNIFRPHNMDNKPSTGYPVLVWVHGGGYGVGASFFYNYRNISLNFVKQDIIVVTIQYRLGFMGFSSTGDKEMPGNLGYWDQVEAFKFLKNNIDSFGGDPDNIIAFGLSAGGASVSALSISPASQDYISKSIEMSGAVFANWHASEQVIDVTKELAEAVGCRYSTSAELKQCFKNKKPEELLEGVNIIGNARYGVNLLNFHPRIDGEFFPMDFDELIKTAKPKPAMIGFTDQEAAYFTIMGLSKSLNKFTIPKEHFQSYQIKNFIDFVENIIAPESIFKSKSKELQQKIINFYINNDDTNDYRNLLKKFNDLLSDLWFTIPGLWTTKAKIDAGWPVYLYYNDYYSNNMFDKDLPVKGSMHANEYPYMFGIYPITKFEFDDDDKLIQPIIVNTIVNFCKNNDPSISEFKWDKTTDKDPYRYALIRPNPKMENNLLKENLEFWNEITENYDFNIVRGVYKSNNNFHNEL